MRGRRNWCTLMLTVFISLKGKVTPSSPHYWCTYRKSLGLCMAGWDDAAFINKGSKARWHWLMDDSTLFWLTGRLTFDVPGCTLAWRALRRFIYQSAGIMTDTEAEVTSVYSHNVCLLFSTDTFHNSCCLTDASESVCIQQPQSWTLIMAFLSAFFFFSLTNNGHFLQCTELTMMVAIWWWNASSNQIK